MKRMNSVAVLFNFFKVSEEWIFNTDNIYPAILQFLCAFNSLEQKHKVQAGYQVGFSETEESGLTCRHQKGFWGKKCCVWE